MFVVFIGLLVKNAINLFHVWYITFKLIWPAVRRATTEQTVVWNVPTLPMVRTVNQTATVLTKTVIIETDAIIQKGVIITHFMREDIYILKLFNKSYIENKSHFIRWSSITEKKSVLTYFEICFTMLFRW